MERKMKLLLWPLFLLSLVGSQNLWGRQQIMFSSRLQWASKGVTGTSLPQALGPQIPFQAQIEIPQPPQTLSKVFEKEFQHENLKARIQIWFHRQEDQRYFSQQISISEKGELLVFCSDYFSFAQTYLVPGACWGRSLLQEKMLVGISIFQP